MRGSDFVETSTGFTDRRATTRDVELLRDCLPESLSVKASGGIEDCARCRGDGGPRVPAGSVRLTSRHHSKDSRNCEEHLMSVEERRWPERRFSQAISEGDGISVIPLLRGDLLALARAAEDAGAEALAVESVRDIERLRFPDGSPPARAGGVEIETSPRP